MEFPQLFKNEDGIELIARDEVQAAAIEKGGFTAAGLYVEKKRKNEE